MKLTVVTVGHNEATNLPKYFNCLKNFDSLCEIKSIYCDQGSTDDSLIVAKKNGAEVYEHGKKWYCEWSRKRCVDNLIEDGEWVLILDCDEEVSYLLAKEICDTISNSNYDIGRLKKNTIAFGMPVGTEYAIRLFKKGAVIVTDTIHEYIKLTHEKYVVLDTILKNDDRKESNGKEVFNWLEKANKYSELDHFKYENFSYFRLYIYLFLKPIESFIYYYFRQKLIGYGHKGFVYSLFHLLYQTMVFAKAILYKYAHKK